MNSTDLASIRRTVTTAILVDGGFYRRRAAFYHGYISPEERVEELISHCRSLLNADKFEQRNLYRIFYYDCPPIDKNVYHPLLNKSINLGNSNDYKWQKQFLETLKSKRKVALRLGRLSENDSTFLLKPDIQKKLIRGAISISDLTEQDFALNITQKGVDMKIGVDITTLSVKKQVEQIILISGDSDFVPAAKQARREGIDFLLNPLGAPIKNDLYEHIDGLIKYIPQKYANKSEHTDETDEQKLTT